MKVIRIDNFDREYISDKLVKDNVTLEEGNQICEDNNIFDEQSWYYKVVEDDYKLYKAPEL